jgi:hypothetical protein
VEVLFARGVEVSILAEVMTTERVGDLKIVLYEEMNAQSF